MTTDTQDLSDDGWENDDDVEEGQDDGQDDAGSDSADENGAAAGSSTDNGRADGDADGGARRRRRRRGGRDSNDLESFDDRSRQAQGFVVQVIQKMGMDCRV